MKILASSLVLVAAFAFAGPVKPGAKSVKTAMCPAKTCCKKGEKEVIAKAAVKKVAAKKVSAKK